VPAFELIAFEDAEPAFRSRIIVGAPGTPTPILDTHVSTVRFRPTWRPTPSMIASGEYRDGVRPPGRNNPLGLAAVRLEPGLLVYLHDTNRRDLFAREARALSHGCIRVERWDELVGWLLDMDLETVHRLADGPRSRDVPAPPVPVLIRYLVRFPDETGALERHPDVYGRGAEPPDDAAPPGPACAAG
jgi:murein L,D-transpeptidase YcbB/YkuD